MTTPRWSFLAPLAIFTVCCSVFLGVILALTGSPLTIHYAAVILYFALITFGLHAWQEHAFATDPKGFVRRFMAALMGKMFLSVVVLVLLLFTVPREIVIPLSLSFAVLYLAFLVFSTMRLMKLSKSAPIT
jgi:hypothetical protein